MADRGPRLPAIEVRGLRVVYRTTRRRVSGRFLGRDLHRRERIDHVALDGIDVDVPSATMVGVIGRNGAGKSTLLRVVAGILPPTDGTVTVRGEVSALLARGVGFNKHLTGRENIQLGGLAAGMRPDKVLARFDDIVEFSGLRDRLDEPVRTYSSGMTSRLAFSIAAHLDPDILLIDEALGAGDGAFKERSREKMLELCGGGRTGLLVSHGLGSVRDLTTHCIWIDGGHVAASGPTDEVLDEYMRAARLTRRAMWDDDYD